MNRKEFRDAICSAGIREPSSDQLDMMFNFYSSNRLPLVELRKYLVKTANGMIRNAQTIRRNAADGKYPPHDQGGDGEPYRHTEDHKLHEADGYDKAACRYAMYVLALSEETNGDVNRLASELADVRRRFDIAMKVMAGKIDIQDIP